MVQYNDANNVSVVPFPSPLPQPHPTHKQKLTHLYKRVGASNTGVEDLFFKISKKDRDANIFYK